MKRGFQDNRTVCRSSNPQLAAKVQGGMYAEENCGFFSVCAGERRIIDEGGPLVSIWYCEPDMIKVVPAAIAALVVVIFIYRWIRRMSWWKRKSRDDDYDDSYHRHRRRHH